MFQASFELAETPEQEIARLEGCVEQQTMIRDAMVNYYNDMGWNHGLQEVTRPLLADTSLARIETELAHARGNFFGGSK